MNNSPGTSDLFYIPECAKRMGKTDAAIRNLICRKSASIPPYVRLPNGKVAFRERDYEKWLNDLHPETIQTKRRGRPRS